MKLSKEEELFLETIRAAREAKERGDEELITPLRAEAMRQLRVLMFGDSGGI